MSSKKAAGSAKGKRYSSEEKAEILAFVQQVNAERGRGGQSAASKKYKISPLTISSWAKAGFGGSIGSGLSSSSGKGGATSGPMGKKLAKLQGLHDQIERAEKELDKLKAQFSALKGSL